MKGDDIIRRILLIEFDDKDSDVFDEIMRILEKQKKHLVFENLKLNDEEIFSLFGFEIYPQSRKIFHGYHEINLTAKEFDILCLLVVNQGYVLTYTQIYEKIWSMDSAGDVNNSVGCHVRSLRRKLQREYPDAPFTIQCLRNIGYRLEMNPK